jgi:hypothetical protein
VGASNYLGEAAPTKDSHCFYNRRFPRIGCRHKELGDAALRRRHRHGQGTLDGPNTPVQGELTHGRKIAQLFGQELAGGNEQTQGDGQIKTTGIFLEIGRG